MFEVVRGGIVLTSSVWRELYKVVQNDLLPSLVYGHPTEREAFFGPCLFTSVHSSLSLGGPVGLINILYGYRSFLSCCYTTGLVPRLVHVCNGVRHSVLVALLTFLQFACLLLVACCLLLAACCLLLLLGDGLGPNQLFFVILIFAILNCCTIWPSVFLKYF